MTEDKTNLVDKCLIATPAIKDPLFAASLVYICEHSKDGSMGLVVNHQTNQTLEDIFLQLDIKCVNETVNKQPVFIGGPVQLDQGFVLHTTSDIWQKTFEVSPGIYLTSSMDVLQAIADNKGPEDYLVILGYSGWESGQLESELQQNSWLTSASGTKLLFHKNSDAKWQMAFDTLGFDISMLSPVSGNA